MDAMALTVRETAQLLGVDEATVRAWARKGRLRRDETAFKRGRGRTVFAVWALLAPTVPPTPHLDVEGLMRLAEAAADRAA